MAKKTQIVQVTPSGWDISNSFDPRTGPAAWTLFILLTVLFWSLRRWLRRTFEIENLDLAAAAAATSPPLKIDAGARLGDDASVTRGDWIVAIFGGMACIAGFLAMQKSIDHRMLRDAETFHGAVNELTTALSHGASLAAAARTAGFQPTDYLRYGIDTIRRRANGQVEIVGFAGDIPGDGNPLAVLVLAGNTIIFQGQTHGARDDIARIFGFTDAAARNVGFSGALSCSAGEPLRVVVATPARTYVYFPIGCP